MQEVDSRATHLLPLTFPHVFSLFLPISLFLTPLSHLSGPPNTLIPLICRQQVYKSNRNVSGLFCDIEFCLFQNLKVAKVTTVQELATQTPPTATH